MSPIEIHTAASDMTGLSFSTQLRADEYRAAKPCRMASVFAMRTVPHTALFCCWSEFADPALRDSAGMRCFAMIHQRCPYHISDFSQLRVAGLSRNR